VKILEKIIGIGINQFNVVLPVHLVVVFKNKNPKLLNNQKPGIAQIVEEVEHHPCMKNPEEAVHNGKKQKFMKNPHMFQIEEIKIATTNGITNLGTSLRNEEPILAVVKHN
jgi:hypothetical protein